MKDQSASTVEGNIINSFESIYAADKKLNIGCRNILYVVQGRVFTAAGFRWFWHDYIPTKRDFLANKIKYSNRPFNTSLWEKLGKSPIDKSNPPACIDLSIKDLPHECWKSIPSFENHYVISNRGRVKRLGSLTCDNNIFLEKIKSCLLI